MRDLRLFIPDSRQVADRGPHYPATFDFSPLSVANCLPTPINAQFEEELAHVLEKIYGRKTPPGKHRMGTGVTTPSGSAASAETFTLTM
jgi:hypothetical protein